MLVAAEELRLHPPVQGAAQILKLREEARRNIARAIELLS